MKSSWQLYSTLNSSSWFVNIKTQNLFSEKAIERQLLTYRVPGMFDTIHFNIFDLPASYLKYKDYNFIGLD
jgi:hypothetical protein